MFEYCCFLWCCVVYLSRAIYAENWTAFERPIWNIGHMVNSISEVTEFLDQGANAIEFDAIFDSENNVVETYHGDGGCDGVGRPCDKREDFRAYLDFMRETTTPGNAKYRETLVLLFIECIIVGLDDAGDVAAGESLAREIVETYWQNGMSGASAYILISVPVVDDIRTFAKSFRDTLRNFDNYPAYESKIGFDVYDYIQPMDDIQKAFESENITENLWQGDGTPINNKDFSRLKEAITERDMPGGSYMKKVYWRDLYELEVAQEALALGVDAIITNYPEKVNEAMDRIKKAPGNPPMLFRLATCDDNPWERFIS